MLTRDTYIAILEKRAAEERAIDNQEAALREYSSNTDDNRSYLKGLFNETGEKDESRQAGKLFPGKSKKESGHVFMKVARQMFDDAIGQADIGVLKTAEPHYREVAFHSFVNELEKIAAVKGQALAQLTARNKARQAAVGSKAWDLSSGLSGATKAMEGSGTSVHGQTSPGFFSRVFGNK